MKPISLRRGTSFEHYLGDEAPSALNRVLSRDCRNPFEVEDGMTYTAFAQQASRRGTPSYLISESVLEGQLNGDFMGHE